MRNFISVRTDYWNIRAWGTLLLSAHNAAWQSQKRSVSFLLLTKHYRGTECSSKFFQLLLNTMDWITKCVERYLAWGTWIVSCGVLVLNCFLLEIPHWTFSVSQEGEALPWPVPVGHWRWRMVAFSCQRCFTHGSSFLPCLCIKTCDFTSFVAFFKNETKVYFKKNKGILFFPITQFC